MKITRKEFFIQGFRYIVLAIIALLGLYIGRRNGTTAASGSCDGQCQGCNLADNCDILSENQPDLNH